MAHAQKCHYEHLSSLADPKSAQKENMGTPTMPSEQKYQNRKFQIGKHPNSQSLRTSNLKHFLYYFYI